MNSRQKFFSIIVPVYKVEKYLNRCVDSLVNQSYQNIEIILVDDGSPDKCGIICDEYAKSDKRVKVIHKRNGGLADARNKGIDMATGDYIMFVDSDDWIERETCMVVLGLFEQYDVDIVSFGIQLVDDKKIIEVQKTPHSHVLTSKEGVGAMVYHQKKNGLLNYVCNKAFRRSIFGGIRFPVGMLFEDQDVTYKLMHNAQTIYATNNVFYNYYQRDGSIMSGFYRPKALHDRILIWMKRYDFMKKYYPEYSKYQLAQVLGDVYIALIVLKHDRQFEDFIVELKEFANQNRGERQSIIGFNKKIMLHYYCYPLFWLYVTFLLKHK